MERYSDIWNSKYLDKITKSLFCHLNNDNGDETFGTLCNKCFKHLLTRDVYYLSRRNGFVRGVLVVASRDDVFRWGKGGGTLAAAAAATAPAPAETSDDDSELVLNSTNNQKDLSVELNRIHRWKFINFYKVFHLKFTGPRHKYI